MSQITNTFIFKTLLWIYPGKAGWHFVTVPKKISVEIKKNFGGKLRGWGSLPVEVVVNKETWKTSIFWDGKMGAYLLPVKAAVRKKAKLETDKKYSFTLYLAL